MSEGAGREVALPTGAALRIRGDAATCVVCLNGTVRAARPGIWGASVQWLAERLSAEFPGIAFAEVRYRVRSWRAIDSCVADGRAALAELRAQGRAPAVLLGYSGGGAVALALSGDADVRQTIALAPWLPRQLDPADLSGRRFLAAHGSLDGFPLLPGTSPRASRDAIDRLAGLGADAEHVTIRGGLHPIALRLGGWILPAPRAAAWRAVAAAEVRRAQDVAGASR